MMTKAKNAKNSSVISSASWAISLMIIILSLVWTESTIDNVLVPRQIFLAAAIIFLNLWMPRKGGERLPFGIGIYFIFLISTLIGHTQAINSVESWAVIARIGLWTGVLITGYRAFILDLVDLRIFSRAVLVAGLLAILFGLPEIARVLNSSKVDVYQVSALFNHKNFFSAALMLTLPFMVAVFLEERTGTWRWLSIVGMILTTLVIFFLRTRGAWLGTFTGVGAMALILFLQKGTRPRISWYLPIGILGIGLFVAGYSISQDSVREKIFDAQNIDNRITMWDRAWKMFKEEPITGVGGGNWKIHFPKYGLDPSDSELNEGTVTLQRPHNDFLWTLSEFGILGGLAYFLFFVYLGYLIIRLSRESKDPSMRFLPIVGFFLAAYTAYSLGEFPMERPFHSALFLLVAGWVLAKGDRGITSLKGPWILPGMAIIFGAFNLWVSSNRFVGEKHAKLMLEYNARQQAVPMIQESLASERTFFNMDNFANPVVYFQGMGDLAQKQILPSRSRFEEALEIHPWHIPSLTQLGNTYKYQNQPAEALAYYDRILEFAPSNRTVRVNKAEVLIRMGRHAEAVPVLFYMTYKTGAFPPKYLQMVSEVSVWMYQNPTQKGVIGWIQERLKRVPNPDPQKLTEEFISIQRSAM